MCDWLVFVKDYKGAMLVFVKMIVMN